MAAVSVLTCAYSGRPVGRPRAGRRIGTRANPTAPGDHPASSHHNDALLQRARERFPEVRVEPEHPVGEVPPGRGTPHATSPAVRSSPSWTMTPMPPRPGSKELVRPFDDPMIAGVGGKALPGWPQERPRWFPEEFDWVVGCSYRGLPTSPSVVRNLIGTNMSVRRDLMIGVGGFREGFGQCRRRRRRGTHGPAPIDGRRNGILHPCPARAPGGTVAVHAFGRRDPSDTSVSDHLPVLRFPLLDRRKREGAAVGPHGTAPQRFLPSGRTRSSYRRVFSAERPPRSDNAMLRASAAPRPSWWDCR